MIRIKYDLMIENNLKVEPRAFFRSLYFWSVFIFLTGFWSIGAFFILGWIYLFSRPKAQSLFHYVSVLWAKTILSGLGSWSVRNVGERPLITTTQNFIIVANHQSILDILVLLASMPVAFRFMAKKELFVIPFLGWHMAFAGYIPVDRSSPEGRRSAAQAAKKCLQWGGSLLMFPEGTRSSDGEILPFKVGAFKLAQNESVKLLPVTMDGAMQVIRKKSWMVAPRVTIKIQIHPPASIAESDSLTVRIQEIRDLMIAALHRMRAGTS